MGIHRMPSGRWRADCKVGDRKVYLGVYPTDTEARAAVDAEYAKIHDGTSALANASTPMLTVAQYAAEIRVPRGTVKRWSTEGMPVRREAGLVRIVRAECDPWVLEHHGESISFGRDSLVYMARREDGAVKVGWTSDVVRRAHELRKEVRQPVHLIAVVPGDKPDELRVHELLKEHRIDGEWFRSGPWVDEVLAGLRRALP